MCASSFAPLALEKKRTWTKEASADATAKERRLELLNIRRCQV